MSEQVDEKITNEEALRALAQYYQRRSAELEEGLVVANAKIERLAGTIQTLKANAVVTDSPDFSIEEFDPATT